MPTKEDSKVAKFYALNKDGEYVPIGELEEVITFVEEASKAMKQLAESINFVIAQIPYKRLSAEVRFKKKHRRQARIDRRNRKKN